MAITYTQLTGAVGVSGSIKNWINRTDLDSAAIVTFAETEIYSRLRVREMRAEATLTVLISTNYVALPAGYLDPISMKDRYFNDIVPNDMDALLAMRANDGNGTPIEGEPSRYAVWDEKFQFDIAMDAQRTFKLLYFKQPDALATTTNETNWLTSRYSHLLLAACRKYAETFTKNFPAKKEAEQDFERILAAVNVNDDLSYRGYVPSERG